METCVSDYTEFMEKQLNENDSYFKEIDLNELHKKGMDDVIVKVYFEINYKSIVLIWIYNDHLNTIFNSLTIRWKLAMRVLWMLIEIN